MQRTCQTIRIDVYQGFKLCEMTLTQKGYDIFISCQLTRQLKVTS